jgi:hypothetical protein
MTRPAPLLPPDSDGPVRRWRSGMLNRVQPPRRRWILGMVRRACIGAGLEEATRQESCAEPDHTSADQDKGKQIEVTASEHILIPRAAQSLSSRQEMFSFIV